MCGCDDEQTGCFSWLLDLCSKAMMKSTPTMRGGKGRSACGRPPPSRVRLEEALQCSPIDYDEQKGSLSLLDEPPSYYSSSLRNDLSNPAIRQTIEETIDALDPFLRELSLDIHDHPELALEERYAHDLLTAFMSLHGFDVTPHYLGLETAWRAEYRQGKGGRVLGVNSEMDALPGLGHACGHNLIAVAGAGIAIAVKAAMEKHNISGTVVLLGTPAEETVGGKIKLLQKGGYADMDACIMCHPCPSIPGSVRMNNFLALRTVEIEYFGHAAHASFAPWEAQNALDAAVLAYSSIAVLRQQIKPDHRVHGIVEGRNWTPNIIPDYAKMRWILRAPTHVELSALYDRVRRCLEAAGLSTNCRYEISGGSVYYDLRQNSVLSQDFVETVDSCYGWSDASTDGMLSASTDFGNVSYALPALHPSFSIPTVIQGGNHSPAFAEAARTEEAHRCTMTVTKALALTGLRVLRDDEFYCEVKKAFNAQPKFVSPR